MLYIYYLKQILKIEILTKGGERKTMRKTNQRYGSLAVSLAILMIISLVMPAFKVTITALGIPVSENSSFFGAISDMGEAAVDFGAVHTLLAIFTILSIIAFAVLIIYGLILSAGKKNKLTTNVFYFRVIMGVAGVIALITAVLATIYAVTVTSSTVTVLGAEVIVPMTATIGVGTIFLLIESAVTIGAAIFAPKFLGNLGEEETAPAAANNAPAPDASANTVLNSARCGKCGSTLEQDGTCPFCKT